MKQLLVLALLLCVSFQVACTKTSTEAAREQATLTNSQLNDQVEAKINSDAELRAADIDVDADADRNMVTLSGEVGSEAMRTRAVELAKAAHAGVNVENKIEVEKGELSRSEYTTEHARQEQERAKANNESVGDSVDDAWIHAKIVAKLITDKDTPERKINVDVNNNVVTLRGWVDDAQAKMEAERIAKETEGVKRVDNRLKIGRG